MSRRRVVVTGLGLISPVGNTVAASLVQPDRGALGHQHDHAFRRHAVRLPHSPAQVTDFKVDDYMPAKEARHMDTFIHYGLAAAVQAVQDSGLPTGDALSDERAERIGCVVGSGIGGLPMIEDMHDELTVTRTAAHLAVLHSGHDHQHGRGPRVDALRLQGPEPVGGDGVHHRPALHRRRRPLDRVRRRRRDGGRRHRGRGVAARRRRLRGDACAVHPQRRSGHRVAPLGQGPRRFRAGRRRGRRGARGIRARQGAWRQDLRRTGRLRHECRRRSHHGTQHRWSAPRDAGRPAQCQARCHRRCSTSTHMAPPRRSAM